MKFPTVTGTTLSGDAVTLPDDLDGDYNILVVSYWRYQTLDVRSWLPFLDRLVETFSPVRYYRLPVMWEFPYTRREMIREGIRMGCRDAATRDRMITLFLNVDVFNQSLGFDDTDTIRILLVDQPGTVFWFTEGRFKHAKGQALQEWLDTRLAADVVDDVQTQK